jgi:hypothetical protein
LRFYFATITVAAWIGFSVMVVCRSQPGCAYAVEYEVQVSDDGLEVRPTEVQWRTLRRVTDGQDETRTLQGLGGHGRYLRVVGLKPGPLPLYLIGEIESPGAPPRR